MKPQSQCVVSTADYARHWADESAIATCERLLIRVYPPRYIGPDRRANAHDRRFYAGQGGRRLLDRKS